MHKTFILLSSLFSWLYQSNKSDTIMIFSVTWFAIWICTCHTYLFFYIAHFWCEKLCQGHQWYFIANKRNLWTVPILHLFQHFVVVARIFFPVQANVLIFLNENDMSFVVSVNCTYFIFLHVKSKEGSFSIKLKIYANSLHSIALECFNWDYKAYPLLYTIVFIAGWYFKSLPRIVL